MERLQRVLAAAGVASRRRSEELILEGRVRVDGDIITELGTKVDPGMQKIEVDGKLIPTVRRRYILLNKPSGYITTTSDERSRYTVMDLVPVNERVVPVGRLDRQTEGLLLLTNDGEIANRVMHPRYGIDKEYEALLDGYPPPEVLDRLRRGITIDGQRTVPEMIRPIRNTEGGTIVRIVIHEGRNRIVRKMFDEVGYPVVKLIRTRVGPLQLGAIPRGTFRDLTDGELKALREAIHMTDEDVTFAERVIDRPLRDRPDPNRMKTGRSRESNADRGARGPGGPPRPHRDDDRRGPARPARDGQRTGPPPPRHDDDRGRPARPARDGQHAGPPQARRDDDARRSGPPRPVRSSRPGTPNGQRPDRRADDQRRSHSGQPTNGPPRPRDERDGDRGRRPGGPQRRDDDRRPPRTSSAPGEQRRDRPAGPPRGGSRPAGPGKPDRGPSGPNRGPKSGPGGPPRGPRPGPGGAGQRPRREHPTGGAGGGGERPPDDNRDRRASGGGEEHSRRDRRPED
ncbi:MAG TPA: pseudouridine synthase [Thermomicrobiales bacterium]|nr:pseudouridine synthase [Thermomicrobiales bacterium]